MLHAIVVRLVGFLHGLKSVHGTESMLYLWDGRCVQLVSGMSMWKWFACRVVSQVCVGVWGCRSHQ